MRQPVCILREPQGLVALVIPEEADASGFSRVPLQELTEREARGRTALLASWEALARACGATAETLAHVLRVLLGTVPGEASPSRSLGHPWLTPPPAPHRRTAAHPRGYRGTLHQPPKRRQPKAVDVRPFLLHRRNLQALLETLRPCRMGPPTRMWTTSSPSPSGMTGRGNLGGPRCNRVREGNSRTAHQGWHDHDTSFWLCGLRAVHRAAAAGERVRRVQAQEQRRGGLLVLGIVLPRP